MKFHGYVKASDGKYYKYNVEIDGKYFCPGNVIIDHGNIYKLEPEKNLLIENFIINLERKTVKTLGKHHDYMLRFDDSFVDAFDNGIEKIEITKDKESDEGEKIIRIKVKDQESIVEIRINKDNQIVGYKNEELREVGKFFLASNTKLRELYLPNLQKAGGQFLFRNQELQTLNLPNLESTEEEFLYKNLKIDSLNLPKLRSVRHSFLLFNKKIHTISMPNLKKVGFDFLYNNLEIDTLDMPSLKEVGNDFLFSNQKIKTVSLPKLQDADDGFLYNNLELDTLSLPNLEVVGGFFLGNNNKLKKLYMPKLQSLGRYFLRDNKKIHKLDLPCIDISGLNGKQTDRIMDMLSLCIKKNKKQKGEPLITSRDIAVLDNNVKLSTGLINYAKRIIDKIKERFVSK